MNGEISIKIYFSATLQKNLSQTSRFDINIRILRSTIKVILLLLHTRNTKVRLFYCFPFENVEFEGGGLGFPSYIVAELTVL